jgi:signal transduction histidine kinase
VFLAVVFNTSFAFDSVLKITQFSHAAWGTDQGSPRLIYAIAQTADDYLWIGAKDGLFRFDGLTFERYQAQPDLPLPSVGVLSLLALPDGGLWIGYSSGEISLLRHGHAVNYGRRDGLPRDGVLSLAQDQAGTIWAGSHDGLVRLEDNRWKGIGREWDFPGPAARGLYVDRTGTLWVATGKSIVFLRKGASRFQSTGIDAGLVMQIVEAPNGKLWMAETTRSVRPVPLHTRLAPSDDTEILVGSQGILFAPEGDLWITTIGDGLRRVSDPEKLKGKIDRFSNSIESYTVKDGLSSDIGASIFRDRDGSIWVGTETGLDRFRRTPSIALRAPPGSPQVRPPSIQSIVADGQSYVRWTDLKLPDGTKNVEIHYTAASLADPRQVKFRYKLDGVDTQWQDADTRRTAYYTNLHPGEYQFHVMAGNRDGAWSSSDAVVDFTIPAFWFQAKWFQVLCGVVLLFLLWMLYRFRVRQLERRFMLAQGTRVDERLRIARELHDTLLQSFHGVMFQFQAARNLLPRKPESAMQTLDEAILATEQALAESRDAIRDLRPESTTQHDLADLMTTAGKELADTHATNGRLPTFTVVVEGKPRMLFPSSQDEIYRIGREVIRNAFSHAVASHIEVEIRYDVGQLRLRIRDDGKGIDPAVLGATGRPGHWGLPGIRERAQRIGSRLEFWSEAGAGTEVELSVPSAIAYEKQRDGRRFRLFHMRGSNGKRS